LTNITPNNLETNFSEQSSNTNNTNFCKYPKTKIIKKLKINLSDIIEKKESEECLNRTTNRTHKGEKNKVNERNMINNIKYQELTSINKKISTKIDNAKINGDQENCQFIPNYSEREHNKKCITNELQKEVESEKPDTKKEINILKLNYMKIKNLDIFPKLKKNPNELIVKIKVNSKEPNKTISNKMPKFLCDNNLNLKTSENINSISVSVNKTDQDYLANEDSKERNNINNSTLYTLYHNRNLTSEKNKDDFFNQINILAGFRNYESKLKKQKGLSSTIYNLKGLQRPEITYYPKYYLPVNSISYGLKNKSVTLEESTSNKYKEKGSRKRKGMYF